MAYALEERERIHRVWSLSILATCISKKRVDPATLSGTRQKGPKVPWSQSPGREALREAAQQAARR